jgi:hypothetical protein
MSLNYEDFMVRYQVKNIRSIRNRNDYNSFDYGSASYQYMNARRPSDEIVEVEILRYMFDELVHHNLSYDHVKKKQNHEAWMRQQYPSVNDAYEKYKMLLELMA